MDQPESTPTIRTNVAAPIVADSSQSQPVKGAAGRAQGPSAIRTFLQQKSSGRIADSSFRGLMFVCALSIFLIVLLIVWVLISNSRLSIHTFGFKFFTQSSWDPVSGDFGALPFIWGTIVSSLLAVAMSVPLALAVSIFLLDICPNFLRGPIGFPH